MSTLPFAEKVEDSVSKVDGEVAVGEDLEFQYKWWRFEHAVWIVFTGIIVLALAGAFGRGPLAKTHRTAADHSIRVGYDRIQRSGTPSDLTVELNQSAIQNGAVHLFISESIPGKLGAMRVAPQPQSSVLGRGGIDYTFAASSTPAKIVFALEPSGPGIFHFGLNVSGHTPIEGKIVVLP